MTTELRLATRRSPLSVRQAGRIAELLETAGDGVRVRLVLVDSSGDRDRTSPVAELTELGAFVRAVQRAVLEGRADLAVHSCKDLPTAGPAELVVAAYPERETPLDVLVGRALSELSPGARVGIGSPRRAAQLLLLRHDLRTMELRGNVETRLRKVADGEAEAAVLAEAGLRRLGREAEIEHRFALEEMVPAPGQGVLAVEARRGSRAAELAGAIDDSGLRRMVEAERSLLAETAAGCRAALGAMAEEDDGPIRLWSFVSDERGSRRAVVTGSDPTEVVKATRAELRI